MRIVLAILLVLLIVPGWTGTERLPLLDRDAVLSARPFVPDGGWPKRIGALEPVGALTLSSPARAFGGFSALAVQQGRALLLSDGGNLVQFAIAGGKLHDARAGYLRDGPGMGWAKRDRDSESLALDSAGRVWIGFERSNAIWRYAAGFARAEASRKPAEMARWRQNGGPESLARLPDGRFVTIAERTPGSGLRRAMLFSGDPTRADTTAARFRYRPPRGYDPSDAAALPGGDLLILNRRWRFPLRFSARLTLVRASAIRPGAIVAGREIADIGADLVGENCEGLAVTRERGQTMVWIVTDNDTSPLRRTVLMKFRLRLRS